MNFKGFITVVVFFALGGLCGGYLFSRSIPRSFLAVDNCQDQCYQPKELAGLITSAAILRAPFLLPGVVLESETCLAIRHPNPEAKVHYVLLPKHDSINITTLTSDDTKYVMGCFALARELVERDHLRAYRLYTNGPAYQDIAYLHFHLVGREMR